MHTLPPTSTYGQRVFRVLSLSLSLSPSFTLTFGVKSPSWNRCGVESWWQRRWALEVASLLTNVRQEIAAMQIIPLSAVHVEEMCTILSSRASVIWLMWRPIGPPGNARVLPSPLSTGSHLMKTNPRPVIRQGQFGSFALQETILTEGVHAD